MCVCLIAEERDFRLCSLTTVKILESSRDLRTYRSKRYLNKIMAFVFWSHEYFFRLLIELAMKRISHKHYMKKEHIVTTFWLSFIYFISKLKKLVCRCVKSISNNNGFLYVYRSCHTKQFFVTFQTGLALKRISHM